MSPSGFGGASSRQVLGLRLPRDRHAVPVQQPRVEQLLHHDRHAADAVEIAHHELPGGSHVDQVRRRARHAVEVVELEVDPGLPGDREQVQHGVRRAGKGHHDRDRVLERLLGEDVPRERAARGDQLGGADAALAREHLPPVVDGGRGRGAREREADRLAHGGHRVRGVHPGARSGRGTRGALDPEQLGVVDRALGVGPDGLEHVLDRDVAVLVRAREDRAAVEVDGRQVQPGHRHHHPRLGLVAAGDPHERVEALGVHHELHRVGDQVAAHQRRLHALVAHRDPVGDGDRAELERDRASLADAFLRERGELAQVVVARRHLVPRRGNGDLRLAEVVLGEADGAEHRASGRAMRSLRDFPAAGAIVLAGHAGTFRGRLRRCGAAA